MTADSVPDPGELLDLLPDAVVVMGPGFVVESVNREAERLYGLTREEMIGRAAGERLALRNQEGVTWGEYNRPFDHPLHIRTAVPEQSWLLPNGVEVLTSARLVRSEPRGEVERIVVTFRSGRGRARLDRERSDLVATVAHELRSPLTGVKGFVQALLNRWDKLNDDQKKLMLTTVSADSDRLSRLIAELLDVARIDTNRLQLYPRPIDVTVLVQRVAESVGAGTARPIGVILPDGSDPALVLPEVMVDPDKFTQVATNLVENAVRHGDGDVTVALTRMDAEADGTDGVRLSVADQGEGIRDELRKRVFTKFWTSRGSGGSGLGLYIVGGLVRAHGGRVVIDDAPGGGALLTCTWPVGRSILD